MSCFKFNADEWLTGKYQLLSPVEKGIFIDIAARLWSGNGVLMNDEYLYRLLRVKKGTLLQALRTLFEMEILQENNGLLSADFVTDQIVKKQEFTLKMKESGAKGGRPKKGKKGYPLPTLSDPFHKEEKENKEKEKVSPTPPLKEKENKEIISLPQNAHAYAKNDGYPRSADDVLAIARSIQVGLPCTKEQAESYFLTRARVDWFDANNNKITAKSIPYDLKTWLLRDQNEQKKAKGQIRERGF